MKVKWLGHSSFMIASDKGLRIITDPYGAYPDLYYKPIEEEADIVVVSHRHGDHFGARIKGNPRIITGAGRKEAKGIEFRGLATYHDASKGRERGPNTVFCFAVDGVRICHLGDLGHQLSESEVADIGQVDVLMIPVGGFYTIDAAEATQICGRIKPRVIIPMHFRNDRCAFPIARVDDFLKGKANVKRVDASEVEFKPEELPSATEIVVLQPAL